MVHTVFSLKSYVFYFAVSLAMPASATFVGSCDSVWKQAKMECNLKWGKGREEGRKYSGARDMSRDGKEHLDMSAEESLKIANCMKKVRHTYCSRDECGKGTACYRMRQKERRLKQAARQQEEHSREMERARQQMQDQDPKKFAERLKKQQELVKTLEEIFSPPAQETPPEEPAPAIASPAPVEACEAGSECHRRLQADEVARRAPEEDEADDSADPALNQQIAALKTALLNSPESRNPASIPLFPEIDMPAGSAESTNKKSLIQEVNNKAKKALATGESIGNTSGGEEQSKEEKEKNQSEAEIDEDFKLDPEDKNPIDDEKINIANFLPKNDPRLRFADFVETQPYEPPLTSASGPSLWQKLNWRYKAIEPLMEK